MADPRSVMQEFRFLEQKRQAGPLTPAEAARHAELRDLVGFEQPAPVRGGFDVGAAAAQLRESLLPAGLRNRPLDAPPPPPPAPAFSSPAPAFTPPPAEEPPPAPVPDPAPGADLLFDPASLGQEVRPQAWNPEAPGYDPDAPYDEAAWIAAGYDPNATYDWSALGGADPGAAAEPTPAWEAEPGLEAAAPVDDIPLEPVPAEGGEPPPLEFGEYDAPGEPLGGDLAEPPEPPPAPEAGGDWFDGTAAIPDVPPLDTPSFGEYDATPAPSAVLDAGGEPFYGGPEGDSIPGGTPLELDDAAPAWSPDGTLEGGFELASDGSFGDPGAAPQAEPWASPEPAAPTEAWESAPALDLSTPFAAVPIPAAEAGAGADESPVEPLDGLEPEETLELVPESPESGFEPAAAAALEPLPSEPGWPPAGLDAPPPAPLPAEVEEEPISLSELDASVEIDVPPEIAAAYDAAAAPVPALDFDAPPPPAAGAAPAGLDPGGPPSFMAEPEGAAPAPGGTVVAGSHRVVVHTLDGEVLRGTLADCDLEAAELALDAGAPEGPTPVPSAGVKAIFFMLAPGEHPPAPQGRRVRVAFRDGRQVAGFSPDYREDGAGFFMIPADTRTNTGRIWVYQAAVKQVSLS